MELHRARVQSLAYFKDRRNVPYIDADVVAREVVEPGTPGGSAAIREMPLVLHVIASMMVH